MLEHVARQALARSDDLMNRLSGWRYNPLYHSGEHGSARVAPAELALDTTVTFSPVRCCS